MTTITISKEGARYEARFSFSFAVKDLVKAAGFRFDALARLWWTQNEALGEALKGSWSLPEFTAKVNAYRDQAQARAQASIAASRAATSDFAVPLSDAVRAKGWNFFPFQRAGVEFSMGRPGTLIADEMGLGKTMQAIGIVNCDPSIKCVLIICKASLKLNWQRECRLWLSRPMSVAIANGAWPSVTPDVVIVNYEMVIKHRDKINAMDIDLMVIDESHMLKNPKAQRTHAILGSRDESGIKARRRVFLTGTPVLNRPAELWTLVHALDPNALGRSWRGYHDRYCGPTRGFRGRTDYNGASHLDELQARLRASIMVRRLKADVLKELPPKRRQVIVLKPESRAELDAIARETEFTKRQEADMEAVRAELARLSDDQASEAYKAAVRRLRQVESVAFTETSAVRKAVAVAKVPRVVEHIRDVLEETPKLVVMAHHHEVMDDIVAELAATHGVVKADGRDSNEKRQEAVDVFQTNNMVQVIVCSMQAMGVGHTLHAASTVIFAELDWVPGIVSQAEDRCHRIGQYDSVLAQHIVLDGSLDCRMAGLVVEKQDIIDKALDKPTDALPGVSHLAPPPTPDPAPKRTGEAPKAADGHCNGEPILSERQMIAVLDALQQLAGMCDGARQLDGVGFNRLDSRFGKELAGYRMLTQKQAQAGRKLVIKYQRQLSPLLVAIVKGA